MRDDSELIRDFVGAREEAAFRELVGRYTGLVYSAALRRLCGDVHGAQDVTQEVFVLLSRKAPGLRRHPTLAGWLYTAVNFKVSEMLRRERRRAEREREIQAMEENMTCPVTDAGWDRLRPALDEAMLELGERDREAVLLRYFQDRPYAEIAARHAVTESAAQKRVDRAIERLRESFARRGLASSSAGLAAILSANAAETVPGGLAAAAGSAGLAAGTATGWPAFFAGAVSLMSTTNKVAAVLAAASLAANVALVGTIRARSAATTVPAAATAGANAQDMTAADAGAGIATNATARANNLTAAQWRELQAGDLATQVARLRALGLPADTIAQLTWAQVWPKYEVRLKEIFGIDKELPPYWENEANTAAFLRTQGRGQAEKAVIVDLLKEMQALLGSDAWRFIPRPMLAELQAQKGGVAAEKVPEILQIENEFQAKQSELLERTGGVLLAADRVEWDALSRAQREAIAQLLSPEERLESDLRDSLTAYVLRDRLAGFNPSEQEYRAIFKLQWEFDQKHGTGVGPEVSQAEREALNSAQAKLTEEIAGVLSPERAADLRFATTFGTLARLATRLDLPMEKARALQPLQARTRMAAVAIRNDRSLDPAAAAAQLAQLAENMRVEATAILGSPAAFELYRLNAVPVVASLYTPPPPP